MEQDNFRLLIADLDPRETEVEKEANLKKKCLRAADRHAQETQKEKDAGLGKISFEAPIDV